MNRRESAVALLAIAACASPRAIRAQTQPGREPYRIALVPDFIPAWDPLLKLFTSAMVEHGHVEGRDYVLIRTGSSFGPDTQQALERALQARPHLLLTMSLGYAVAARQRTKTIPVVMWVSGFPIEGGVAESLARPGGNVTGLTIYAGGEIFGKLVQMVHEVKPGIKRIGALMSYVPPFHPRAETDLIVDGMRSAARLLGADVRIYEIAKPEQVDDALASVAKDAVEALVLTQGPSMFVRRNDIMRFVVERRLPTIADTGWESAGDPQPLLVYEADFGTLIQQAVPYVDKILWRGAKPGELPIQLPARFAFTVNQKTAKSIGLTVPRSILLRADQVIE